MPLFGPPNIGRLSAKKNVAGLIKALAWQQQDDIRAGAARALGQIGDTRAVMPLTVTLRDPQWSVRLASAEALAQIPDVRALDHLIAASSDDSVFVRMAAGRALVNIGPPAVEPLIEALTDDELSVPYTRQTAATALGRLHDLGAVEPLVGALLKDTSADTRLFAADSLGMLGDPRAVAGLVTALHDDRDASVRDAAAEALGRFDDPRADQALAGVEHS